MPYINPFLKAYTAVHGSGFIVSPRGEAILEVEDGRIVFQPNDSIISSFGARQLNLNYCKQELLWYLRADRYDTSIEKHATMWKKLQQDDGGYNSNYGQYIFKGPNSQFAYVIETLQRDKDSRRAAMVLLNRDHLYHDNTDVVCTYAMSFRIRNNRLNMSVNMRSNDLIWGATNDVFCFGMIHRMLLAVLKDFYPYLTLGSYTHKADSLHVYERHWPMLELLVREGMSGYRYVGFPTITVDDVDELLNETKGSGEFAKWLNS